MTSSTPKPQPASGRPNPAAMPKHTPKPGPRPGVAQSIASQRVVPLTHAQGSSTNTDPSKFGRVDAEGNVFVTRDGVERQIASWQAGTPRKGSATTGSVSTTSLLRPRYWKRASPRTRKTRTLCNAACSN